MTDSTEDALYAAVDWGTTSFRLWLIGPDSRVLGESRGADGMTKAATVGFSEVLERHLRIAGARPGLPVIICGMAGAKQGWVEAPYLALPARLDRLHLHAVYCPDDSDIRILPGLSQNLAHQPNVMRGEETQLLGLPGTDGPRMICMPGTHCKWVYMQGAEVVHFDSYMTGEIFSVLSHYSVLKHSVMIESRISPDDPDFIAALDHARTAPETAFGRLFDVRAAQLLGYKRPEAGAAHLSGLLIGTEISVMSRHIQGPVTLVSSGQLATLYATGLSRAGIAIEHHNAEEVTRRGLAIAGTRIWGERK